MLIIAVELLLMLLPMLAGVILLAAGRVLREKVALAATGAVAGLALVVTVAYGVTAITGMRLGVVAAVWLAAALGAGALLRGTAAWAYWRSLPLDYTAVRVALVSLSIAILLVARLLYWDRGGLTTGVLNAWGDLPWHMANITLFAEGQSVPPENPIYAGARLTYPFLVNFFSGLLLATGSSYVRSVVWPSLVLLPLTFVLYYCLTRAVTGRRAAGVLAVLLLMTSGSTLGFIRIWADWQSAGQTLGEFLWQLPRDYTGSSGAADGYHFTNPILSLLLPQRAFLFGMPLAFGVVLLLVHGRRTGWGAYLAAGVLAGLLPLFHAHTVLALAPVVVAIFGYDLWRTWRSAGAAARLLRHWGLFVLMAGLIGLPEVLYYLRGASGEGAFFRWGPRWMARDTPLPWFWFKNTGLLLPLTLAALLLAEKRLAKALAAAALVIFVAANLWLFAPWAYDNTKLLIYWLLFSLPLVSGLLVRGLNVRRRVIAGAALAVIVLQSVSGTIDLLKTALATGARWEVWDQDAVALAALIRAGTPVGSVMLTAPYQNNPVALAGRPVYLGYTGHVWSHGFKPWPREAAVKAFYEGQRAVLPDVQPRYVVVGPVERQRFPGLVIRPDWLLVAEAGSYQLYELTGLQ